jgi:hypothetical protein
VAKFSCEWRDRLNGRAVARLVLHGDQVYIETEGNHDGAVVFTTVKIDRTEFVAGIKHIGGIFP